MKMYDYLVTYSFNMEGYLSQCNGSIYLSRIQKIKTFDDLRDVASYISEHVKGSSNIVISNFILLGRNKH